MFTAFLDTCVLWPSLQRDVLLSMGFEKLYQPKWSAAVLEELAYEEHEKLINRGVAAATAKSRVRRLIKEMQSNFTSAEITDWEDFEVPPGLPDPDDIHVIAAANVGRVNAIITDNRKDFPASHLPHSVEVLTPKDFVARMVSRDPETAKTAVEVMARRSGVHGPRLTASDILDILEHRYGMTQAADLIRQV
nr:PIN domain-containing protein [Kibdelosporangium sp. MJ126-NF4]CEL18770.1 hypothetical protein [Kibdelosporangium sp. MJ126-NF4]CTQ96377.1 hypothetical protein [Kibdelosporangium sp. MJ126-NF4]